MRKIVLALAAAGTVLAGGVAMANPLQLAQADISIGIGDHRGYDRDWDHRRGWDRGYSYRHGYRAEYPGCRTVTVRERRGDTVVVRRIRRCG
jgi:hypothetical protein